MTEDNRIELLKLAVDLAKASLGDKTGNASVALADAKKAATAKKSNTISELVTHYYEHLSHLASTGEKS